MLNLALKKLLYGLLTLYGVVSIVFYLFYMLPGDPARMLLDQREDAQQLQRIKKKYGFDKTISQQYFLYLNDLSPLSVHALDNQSFSNFENHGYSGKRLFEIGHSAIYLKWPYFRTSFQKNGKSVLAIIKETLPNTLVLTSVSIVLAFILGLILGVVSAFNKGKLLDKLAVVFSTLGMSVPSFFSAILFAWLFGFVLKNWTGLPMTGSLFEVDDFGEGKVLVLKNLILPALVLGIRPLAVVTQMTRNAVLEEWGKDYVRTARSKGLNEFQIVWRHVLKNAMNPVVTTISGWFASLLTGAVFVEYIFNWNGMGKEMVNALNSMDLPVLMGIVIVVASTFIFINILLDFVYRWLDPRVRMSD